ncbi:unnamed protein product [Ectocarpus sp. CCAP 1310/34]|nr:unnamed protein product [Ectocarpus sp. CCAP 1310/34]
MSDSSSSDGEDTWIQWFCGLEGHEMFCEIDRGYIEDAFNLYGLRHFVPRINDSLDLILDRTAQNEASHELMEATCALYGLIHARYVLTAAGLEAMYAKYTLQEFGNCPHFLCKRQSVVPLGVRDEPHIETVKLYCPKCQNVYVHPSHAAQRVDGAYFGTTFPHLFFMTYGTLVPDPLDKTFVPRVFGFRVHSTAPNGASASGDHHDQRLQERKRLRRANLPPPKEPGGAGEGGTGVEAPAPRGAVAGAVASGAGKGKGRAKEGADTGGGRNGSGVVVHIKEEEGSWSTGGGVREKGMGAAAGSGPETVAGEAEVEEADCRKDARSGRSGTSERMEDGGDRHGSSHGVENGRETSPIVALQHSGTPTEGKGPAESNCVTIATPQRSDGGNAENGSARCSSHDRDAADADERAAAMTKTDGIANSESLPRDACAVGRGSRSGDGAAQTSAAVTAAAAAAATTESSSKSDGPQKDRGKKRSSEIELETELSREADGGGGDDGGSGAGEAGGGGGGGGGGGRTRGKVLRGGRNHASPAARGVSSLMSAAPATTAMAVKGGVVGSPGGRRIGQGRSPV